MTRAATPPAGGDRPGGVPGAAAGPGTTLVLGGARSGKSRHAERLVTATGLRRVYVATTELDPADDDLAARVARHRADRGPGWTTVEEPLDLPGALRANAGPGSAVLVDCLTLWLSALSWHRRDPETAVTTLVTTLDDLHTGGAGPIVLVSNEIGLGLHPETALGRAFRDDHGRMNQTVAAAARTVLLLVAGIPMAVKTTGEAEG